MSKSAYIADGYTESALLSGVYERYGLDGKVIRKDVMHDPVTIEFRPMTPIEQAEYSKEYDRISKKQDNDPVALRKLIGDWLEKKLVNWDLTFGDSKLPITAQNIMRLKDDCLFRLWRIVSLAEVGDDAEQGAKPVNLVESQGN